MLIIIFYRNGQTYLKKKKIRKPRRPSESGPPTSGKKFGNTKSSFKPSAKTEWNTGLPLVKWEDSAIGIIEKNFYKETEVIKQMSAEDVEEFR